MKVRSYKERSNNHVQVNHCVVDCLSCQLLCATQNQVSHREVHSARGAWAVYMVYIPIQQPLSGLHVLPGSIPYLPGTKMAKGPKCAIWGKTHVFPTNHDPLYTETLSFWFTAPPLVRVLKRKLGPRRGGEFRLTPSRGHNIVPETRACVHEHFETGKLSCVAVYLKQLKERFPKSATLNQLILEKCGPLERSVLMVMWSCFLCKGLTATGSWTGGGCQASSEAEFIRSTASSQRATYIGWNAFLQFNF